MINTIQKIAVFGLALFALSGCVVENELSEGISYSGGNAIAHNSSLQIIDPWPENVQDTSLVVPAESGDESATETSADTSATVSSAVPTAVN